MQFWILLLRNYNFIPQNVGSVTQTTMHHISKNNSGSMINKDHQKDAKVYNQTFILL